MRGIAAVIQTWRRGESQIGLKRAGKSKQNEELLSVNAGRNK